VTRRDLAFIASVLGSSPVGDETLSVLAEHFTRALTERNPFFDRTEFSARSSKRRQIRISD
jgi:hypothetical protein